MPETTPQNVISANITYKSVPTLSDFQTSLKTCSWIQFTCIIVMLFFRQLSGGPRFFKKYQNFKTFWTIFLLDCYLESCNTIRLWTLQRFLEPPSRTPASRSFLSIRGTRMVFVVPKHRSVCTRKKYTKLKFLKFWVISWPVQLSNL